LWDIEADGTRQARQSREIVVACLFCLNLGMGEAIRRVEGGLSY